MADVVLKRHCKLLSFFTIYQFRSDGVGLLGLGWISKFYVNREKCEYPGAGGGLLFGFQRNESEFCGTQRRGRAVAGDRCRCFPGYD